MLILSSFLHLNFDTLRSLMNSNFKFLAPTIKILCCIQTGQSKYSRCITHTCLIAGLLTFNRVYSHNVNRNNREHVAPSQSLQLPELPEVNRCPVLSCVASVHLSPLSGSFLTGVLKIIDLSSHISVNPKQKDSSVSRPQ